MISNSTTGKELFAEQLNAPTKLTESLSLLWQSNRWLKFFMAFQFFICTG